MTKSRLKAIAKFIDLFEHQRLFQWFRKNASQFSNSPNFGYVPDTRQSIYKCIDFP